MFDSDVNVTAYSPLGAPGGPGKGAKDPLLENKVVQGIAKKHGKTAAQVLIRFHVDSNVIVIPKSVSQRRIEEVISMISVRILLPHNHNGGVQNFDIWNFQLDEDDLAHLNALNRNLRYFPQDWMGFPCFT